MDWDDITPKKPKTAAAVGDNLSALSVAELEARIADLEGEILGDREGQGKSELPAAADLLEAAAPPAAAADLDVATAVTLESWIRPAADSLRPSGFVMLVSHHDHNSSSGYALGIANKALELRIYGSGAPSFLRSTVALRQDVWQHVAGSFDGQRLRVFIDGVRYGEADVGSQTINPCACELRVGNAATTVGYFFYGDIDEVRVSRTARYTSNFSRPDAPPAADGDAIVVWHFDEGTGQSTADATGLRQGRLGAEPGPDVRDPTWIEVPCVAALGG